MGVFKDGWLAGMDGCINEWVHACTDVCMGAIMDAWMDKWMDRWLDEWIEGIEGLLNGCMH